MPARPSQTVTGVVEGLPSARNVDDRALFIKKEFPEPVQVVVRDNNVDQALKVLKKKMQREGVWREMKMRRAYEKPSEKRIRKAAEAVRRRPFRVVLFDEIEKAHPQVFNILLQVLDDGRLTDGHGRTVDFRNTVLILTSNLGTTEFGRPQGMGFLRHADHESESQRLRESVEDALKKAFRPEFLNRLD